MNNRVYIHEASQIDGINFLLDWIKSEMKEQKAGVSTGTVSARKC
jgi:hypothetical protein